MFQPRLREFAVAISLVFLAAAVTLVARQVHRQVAPSARSQQQSALKRLTTVSAPVLRNVSKSPSQARIVSMRSDVAVTYFFSASLAPNLDIAYLRVEAA